MLSFRDPNCFHVKVQSSSPGGFKISLESFMVDHGGERMEKVCLLLTAPNPSLELMSIGKNQSHISTNVQGVSVM